MWDTLVLPVATYLGLQGLEKAIPPMGAVSAGLGIVQAIDDAMQKEAVASVLEVNKNADGSLPPIILLSAWEPAKDTWDKEGGGRPLGKSDLKKWVDKQGGVAWFQVGANGRSEAYWHPNKQFQPRVPKRDPGLPKTDKLSIGHVVRGEKNAQ
jgi:hypothetical protein